MVDLLGVVILGGFFALPFGIALYKDLKGKKSSEKKKPNTQNLTEYILPFGPKLKSTLREFVEIETTKSKEPLGITVSKFGGVPYFPQRLEYPTDKNSEKLLFLAQINFSEVPHLDSFPKEGILQFFISGGWELGLDDKSIVGGLNNKVLFHPTISSANLITDPSFFPDTKNFKSFPFKGEFSLSFTKSEECISLMDYRFESVVGDKSFLEKVEYDTAIIQKTLGIKCDGTGHKLGGYPYFTQWDSRDHEEIRKLESENDKFELLFQMDSKFRNNNWEIIWGDAGVANFFIRPSDLKKLDFSQVLYSWDCS